MPRYALIALKPFPYGRLKLKPGDAFEALTQSDYALLTQIGHARSPDDPGVYRSGIIPPDEVAAYQIGMVPENTGMPPVVIIEHPGTPPVVDLGETAQPMTMTRKRGRPRKYQHKDLEAE